MREDDNKNTPALRESDSGGPVETSQPAADPV
jgi:hypothetical protein